MLTSVRPSRPYAVATCLSALLLPSACQSSSPKTQPADTADANVSLDPTSRGSSADPADPTRGDTRHRESSSLDFPTGPSLETAGLSNDDTNLSLQTTNDSTTPPGGTGADGVTATLEPTASSGVTDPSPSSMDSSVASTAASTVTSTVTSTTPPIPVCTAAGGSSSVTQPVLLTSLGDRWHEAWLGSPTVADLDGDGALEVVAPRDNLLVAWHLDGKVVFRGETDGRIWASPVVADLKPSTPGLEVAVASREHVYVWSATGELLPEFPTTWRDELRALASADIDDDGALELVAVTTRELEANDRADILIAYELDGSVVEGFPPNTTGTSGCDDACYVHGGFDQTLALGDLDGNGSADIFAPQDNAYVSLHLGSGEAFASDPVFANRSKTNGVRFLLDLDEAKQGYANNNNTALQAHFTNSAPALADLDGDGTLDLVVLGSVQNAAQTDREQGVALWAFRPDGTRLGAWVEPLHIPAYLAGLWDFDGTNVVAATNQVSVAEISADAPGIEIVFAGFDGAIHAASSDAQLLWSYPFTTDPHVLTGGVLVADLSADGSPEIIFNTYSIDEGKSDLVVLDATGNLSHALPLPGRGAMPVPTVADADGDGSLEILVSLKDADDSAPQILVYTVPGSKTNCMPWPTGRGNLLRTGLVPTED